MKRQRCPFRLNGTYRFTSARVGASICSGAMDDDLVLREMVKKALEGKGVLAQLRVSCITWKIHDLKNGKTLKNVDSGRRLVPTCLSCANYAVCTRQCRALTKYPFFEEALPQ